MVGFGWLWSVMVIYFVFWSIMGIYGNLGVWLWLIIVSCNLLWLIMVIRGWLCFVTVDYYWLEIVIIDYGWLYRCWSIMVGCGWLWSIIINYVFSITVIYGRLWLFIMDYYCLIMVNDNLCGRLLSIIIYQNRLWRIMAKYDYLCVIVFAYNSWCNRAWL